MAKKTTAENSPFLLAFNDKYLREEIRIEAVRLGITMSQHIVDILKKRRVESATEKTSHIKLVG